MEAKTSQVSCRHSFVQGGHGKRRVTLCHEKKFLPQKALFAKTLAKGPANVARGGSKEKEKTIAFRTFELMGGGGGWGKREKGTRPLNAVATNCEKRCLGQEHSALME